jgi:hypothetical protein
VRQYRDGCFSHACIDALSQDGAFLDQPISNTVYHSRRFDGHGNQEVVFVWRLKFGEVQRLRDDNFDATAPFKPQQPAAGDGQPQSLSLQPMVEALAPPVLARASTQRAECPVLSRLGTMQCWKRCAVCCYVVAVPLSTMQHSTVLGGGLLARMCRVRRLVPVAVVTTCAPPVKTVVKRKMSHGSGLLAGLSGEAG